MLKSIVVIGDSENIPKKAMESPALFKLAPEYPAYFEGKVPLTIKMKKTVTGDLPMIMPGSADLIAVGGNEYYCWVNSYGAVTAILPNNEQLGVKPNEFEVVLYHNVIK